MSQTRVELTGRFVILVLLLPLLGIEVIGTVAAAEPKHARMRPVTPRPLPDHPGNVFLEGESVAIPLPDSASTAITSWRLLDDTQQVLRTGDWSAPARRSRQQVELGRLEVGWYRLEFGSTNRDVSSWTTLAVLRRWAAPVQRDTPIALDSAAAWFARGDRRQQDRLAHLAALAGVSWVRDRLRWSDLQPQPGALKPGPTTYDTSAEVQRLAGLQVLQVFHDTPSWARTMPVAGGQFAPDLRIVYDFARRLAQRFHGQVGAWEPWNEGNVATFGAHTVDELCSWQKAAWLGFKAGDPDVLVGWNATAAVPTPAQTEGVLANGTWPYFDTYNIHSYDWPESYEPLWAPAREAAAGRPMWITEADRGTPHQKNPPWYDQEPRFERRKAEWMAQAYASSLFAGADRHFHFILGHYHEPNAVQFGLLRLDLTPRPAYVALAAVGRCLAGARCLGRWQPSPEIHVFAFRARPDGRERDVLVAWAEKPGEWSDRGKMRAELALPRNVTVDEVVDYLGRRRPAETAKSVSSAPIFLMLPLGQAARLPLTPPPARSAWRSGRAVPVVLQLSLPHTESRRVEDLPWSEGYAWHARAGESLALPFRIYNFGTNATRVRLQLERAPDGWEVGLPPTEAELRPMERREVSGNLRIAPNAKSMDGWVVLRAVGDLPESPKLAFRVVADSRH